MQMIIAEQNQTVVTGTITEAIVTKKKKNEEDLRKDIEIGKEELNIQP